MGDDIPVAHSMDTRWFAIDEVGHVAIFETGENGHVPEIAEDAEELIEQVWRHRHQEGGQSPWEHDELAAELGVFVYDYDDSFFDPIGSYRRVQVPKTPLHIDQLPPALRQQAKKSCLEKVDFAQKELIQPLEQCQAVYWYEENRVAYLCSDGKTVRPVPGMEHRFADFREQFRNENPQEAEKLIFEG
jgi:hypothetical protein